MQAALDGEEVWIARAGKPLVRLVPDSPAHQLGGRGSLDLEAASIDAASSPEVESAVAGLIAGATEASP